MMTSVAPRLSTVPTAAATTPSTPPPIPPFETLSDSERAKYSASGPTDCAEFNYVHDKASKQPEPGAAEIAYCKAHEYLHAQQLMDYPYRINTDVMSVLETAAILIGDPNGALGRMFPIPGLLIGVIGRMLSIPMALIALNGALEMKCGKDHRDRRLLMDGAFNVGIGAASTVAAFAPLGVATFIPIGLVFARDAVMAATGSPLWHTGP